MKIPLLLIGGGGHCRSCIDVIQLSNRFEVVGILDAKGVALADVMGIPVLGTDSDLAKFADSNPSIEFLITVGAIGRTARRTQLYDFARSLGLNAATIISPRSHIGRTASVGAGTVVLHDCIINSAATVGKNCIINTKALIEHDATIGADTHIATAAVINGGARVGHGCFIGSGSVLLQGVDIPDGTIVGAGSVVTKSLDVPGVYYGNPAKLIRQF